MIKLVFPVFGKNFLYVFALLSSLLVNLGSMPVARAQAQQQPFLFAITTVNGQEAAITFLRDETSSGLTLLPAAPIPFKDQCLPEAIDLQSSPLFLFGACASGLAMFSFDGTTGAVAEILTSPFTQPNTSGNGVYTIAESRSLAGTGRVVPDCVAGQPCTDPLASQNHRARNERDGSDTPTILLVLSGIGCGGGGSQTTTPQPQEQQQQAATPAILPVGGTFTGAQTTTISDTTAGATIYYTTDGTTPTVSSAIYSAPISLNSAATVQAIATASGFKTSTVASANYKFKTPLGSYGLTVIPTVTAAGSGRS